MKKIFLLMALSLLPFLGCASLIPEKKVTLIDSVGTHFTGTIKYDDGLSGTLTIPEGPGGESFSGHFVVVDQTSVSKQQGSLIIPQSAQMPAVGGMNQTHSGEVRAFGHWYGIGSNGSRIEGTMTVGRGGHGHGTCKDSKGNSYKILF